MAVAEDGLNALHGPIDLVLTDDQWWGKAGDGAVSILAEDTGIAQGVAVGSGFDG